MALSTRKLGMTLSVGDVVISLTLANFVLLKEWRLLLGNMMYFNAPERRRFLAIVFCSILFAAVFLCGIWLARRSGRLGQFVARWLFVQLIIYGLFLLNSHRIPHALFLPTVVLIPLLLVVHPAVPRGIATLFVAISPCVLFLYARGAWEVRHVSSPQVIQGSMSRLEKEGPRVLVVIFDALGEKVPFTSRPKGLEVPAFDRLRSEAFVATAAYPPSNRTLTSLPALLTSRLVQQVKPSRGNLKLNYVHQSEFQSLADTRTIFSEVHDLGLGTAMIGWYHPYCVILQDVDFCAHVESDDQDERYERGGFPDKVLDVFAGLPLLRDTVWGRQRNAKGARDSHEHETLFLTNVALKALPQFHSGLMIVHLPIPHPPALTGVYFANLIEADNGLQAIRSVMEKANTWEGTTVLVTSDHWWRTRTLDRQIPGFAWTGDELAYVNAEKDKRVPFIVKLPNQNHGETYSQEFNTVILSKLVYDCFAGKIRSGDDVRAWIDTRRIDIPVHAYANLQ